MPRTIRARTTVTAVLVMTLTLVIASVALVVLLGRSLRRDVDARATLRLQDEVALASQGRLPSTLAGADEDGTVGQVVVGGRVVAQSPVVRGSRPIGRAPRHSGVELHTVKGAPIVGGATFRIAAQDINTPQGRGVAFAAASLEPVSDSINAVEALLVFVVPCLLLFVGVMTWWLTGRVLEPVEAIRRQVAEISATELTRRVPEPGTRDEIDRLAQTMNSMLVRLDDAMHRQRTFVSDAAHELRSPLAAMRTELDVAAAHPEATNWSGLIERLSATNARLERLVEDLLVLATAEEQGTRRRTEVDLDDIVLRQLEPRHAGAGALAINLDH